MTRRPPLKNQRHERILNLRIAFGLTILAWISRFCFLFSNQDRSWGFSVFYEGDSEKFFHFAQSLLSGQSYDGGIPFHPPGFPYFLAGVYKLLGVSAHPSAAALLQIKIVMILVSSLSAGLIYLILKPFLGRVIAITGSVLCVYSFGLSVISLSPVSEGLYLLCLLLCIFLWSRRFVHWLSISAGAGKEVHHISSRWLIINSLLLGALLGALSLIRAEGILVALLFCLIGLISQFHRVPQSIKKLPTSRRLLPWGVVAIGIILVISPWTIRNYKQLSSINQQYADKLEEPLPTFVPITAYGPLNLALANNKDADGTFSPSLITEINSETFSIFNPQQLHLFLHGDTVAWRFIVNQPGKFLRLVFSKWGLMLEANKLGWTQWNLPAGLSGLRRPVDLFVPHSRTGLWTTIPLLIWGLVSSLRAGGLAGRWAWIVICLTGHTLIVTGLFFGYSRFGVLMFPFWFSMIAVSLVQIYQRLDHLFLSNIPLFRKKSRKLISRIGYILLAGLVLIEILGAFSGREFTSRGTILPGQSHLNPDSYIYLEVSSSNPD